MAHMDRAVGKVLGKGWILQEIRGLWRGRAENTSSSWTECSIITHSLEWLIQVEPWSNLLPQRPCSNLVSDPRIPSIRLSIRTRRLSISGRRYLLSVSAPSCQDAILVSSVYRDSAVCSQYEPERRHATGFPRVGSSWRFLDSSLD